ncbi:hybrid sensor histidine kinase/response regulator [Roseiarcus fermentans]|uniref:hybrid sensor histidine kinase/response regulator n=1 Tax=Roseiarcus fermentans TaxID=1473586 RepID=UPI001472A570|nr:hybrid sensor histidine kinase/response regulator [Roseiarcus fermentans]
MTTIRYRLGKPRGWPYYGAALAITLLFALLSAWVVGQDRSADYASERRAMLNTARLVADNLGESFDRIDALLKSVGRLYASGRASAPGDAARLADDLNKEIADHPIVARLYVADAGGKIVAGGGAFVSAPTAFHVADAAFFRQAAAGDHGLIFSGPAKARFGPGWLIALSRRVDDDKGEFLGVVSASITVDALTRLFSTLDYVDRGVVALWTDDGVLVARYAKESGPDALVGADILSGTAKALLREHPEQDHNAYDGPSSVDGVDRLFAYQKIGAAPYLVVVGVPKAALDQTWRRIAVALGLLCAAIAVATFWIARRQHAWALHLDEDNRLLEQRVAERTAELEHKNRALVASERKFSDAMESASNPMALVSPDGRFLEVNSAACALLGHTRDELLALPVRSIVAPDQTPPDLDMARRLATGEAPTYRVVRRFLHKDGRSIPVQVDVSAARNAFGYAEYYIAQGQDVSARLAYENRLETLNAELLERVEREVEARRSAQARLAQNEKMAALGELAGGVAHDFNSVLQVVRIGAASIGRLPGDPGRVRSFAAMIEKATARGAAITGRLLAFARRNEPSLGPVDIASALSDVVAALKSTIRSGVRLVVDVAPDLPDAVADRALLEAALVNLATNAADAIAGEGRITFSARRQRAFDGDLHGLQPGDYVRIDVEDDGVGMDETTLSRAFEPFFTTKAVGRGTGLGLPTVRAFAEQSGGALALASRPGEGTTASLWLAVAAGEETSATLAAPAGADAGGALRVLLVDADETLRETLARDLAKYGLMVDAAAGVEALALLDAGREYDVIVTDAATPAPSGVTVLEEARRRNPDVPVVALTGNAAAPDLATLAGARVRQPISTVALARAIVGAARTVGASPRRWGMRA